jgi:hypothetical protein
MAEPESRACLHKVLSPSLELARSSESLSFSGSTLLSPPQSLTPSHPVTVSLRAGTTKLTLIVGPFIGTPANRCAHHSKVQHLRRRRWFQMMMMMSFNCSYRNKNEPTAIYPSLGYSPRKEKLSICDDAPTMTLVVQWWFFVPFGTRGRVIFPLSGNLPQCPFYK